VCKVVFTVSNHSAGTIRVAIGNGTAGTIRSADDTYTETLTAGAATMLTFAASSDFIGSIDDVSVKEIF
jgi:hypothetical protein